MDAARLLLDTSEPLSARREKGEDEEGGAASAKTSQPRPLLNQAAAETAAGDSTASGATSAPARIDQA
ncbi:hypothetical protein JCM9534A_26970 [Catenuloplanes indicus JCM 9534]